MNFNIYVEDSLGEKLEELCQITGKKRNSIIREALEAWIAKHAMSSWSDSILKYEGREVDIEFESYREELLSPNEESF